MNRNKPYWTSLLLALALTTVCAHQGPISKSCADQPIATHQESCGCNQCQSRRSCRRCPKCQHDVCVLNAECVKDRRLCFEVEQKLICIPKFSLPWRKCEKPCGNDCASNCRHKCAKSKTVKVLKTKYYECDVCQYSWKVYEPQELGANGTQETPQQPDEPQFEATPEQPKFDDTELFDPSGKDVPQAPVMNDSARSFFRRFSRR